MKITRKTITIFCSFIVMLVAAILINLKASTKEIVAEVTWKLSAALTLLLESLGHGASSGMDYLNTNAGGVGALCTIIGLGFSIYFQYKRSKNKDDD